MDLLTLVDSIIYYLNKHDISYDLILNDTNKFFTLFCNDEILTLDTADYFKSLGYKIDCSMLHKQVIIYLK